MITIDFSIVAELVCVLFMIAILNAILYKPLRNIMKQRKEKMDSIDAEAAKFEANTKRLIEDFENKMKEARLAGKEEFDKFKAAAKEQEQKLIDESTKEAEARREELMAQLASQIDAARKDLKAKAEAFAMEIAQKLLGRAV